eukprot:6110902-Amphidinium_carterae.1
MGGSLPLLLHLDHQLRKSGLVRHLAVVLTREPGWEKHSTVQTQNRVLTVHAVLPSHALGW